MKMFNVFAITLVAQFLSFFIVLVFENERPITALISNEINLRPLTETMLSIAFSFQLCFWAYKILDPLLDRMLRLPLLPKK